MKLAFKFDSGKVVSHEVFERTFTIGRSEKCRVTLDNEGFSREHCLIEIVDGVIYVTDLGSKNGVFINHVRIPPKLRVSYDTKLPLYVGEAFLTMDPSKEFRDPDHLSLQTFSKIDPAEIYKPLNRPKKLAPPAPKQQPYKSVQKKDNSSGGLSLVIAIVLIAGIVIYLNRSSSKAHHQGADQHK